MPCYHPLKAFYGRTCGPSGKARIVFNEAESCGVSVDLPCGQCIGCRLERSRQWAVRCMHEASLHEENCFITLTYRPEDLPADGSLNKKHFQDFMKRLRFRFGERRIRYFHCGEYGEAFSRPHYHACLFGVDFPDKVYYKNAGEDKLYTSAILDSCWGLGFCAVGAVTFESAAYVARYVMKKVTGEAADAHYMRLSEVTGELYPVLPEYVTMSRRPGLARGWFERFGNEVYPSDEVIVRGFPCRPPRYYDNLFASAHGDLDCIKLERKRSMLVHKDNCTADRLKVREQCAQARVALLKRPVEQS